MSHVNNVTSSAADVMHLLSDTCGGKYSHPTILKPDGRFDGVKLSTLLDPFALTKDGVVQVVHQLIEALRFLHSRDICHGAISADCVFVKVGASSTELQVKLGTFDEAVQSDTAQDKERDLRQLGVLIARLLKTGPAAAPYLTSAMPELAWVSRQLQTEELKYSAWKLDAMLTQRAMLRKLEPFPLLSAAAAVLLKDDGSADGNADDEVELKLFDPTAAAEHLGRILQNGSMFLPMITCLARLIMSSTKDPGALLEMVNAEGKTPLELLIERRPLDVPLFTLLLDLGHGKGQLCVGSHDKVLRYVFRNNMRTAADALVGRWYELQEGSTFDFDGRLFDELLTLSAASGASDTCLLLLAYLPHTLLQETALRVTMAAATSGFSSVFHGLMRFAEAERDIPTADAGRHTAPQFKLDDLVDAMVAEWTAEKLIESRGVYFEFIVATAAHGRTDLCKMLLKHIRTRFLFKLWKQSVVAAIDSAAKHSQDAVWLALLHKSADSVVHADIDPGVDQVKRVDRREIANQALLSASRYNKGRLLSRALELQADPTTRDVTTRGWTCVHLAAVSGYDAILRTVLEEGSKKLKLVELLDDGGRTPLHLAAQNGHETTSLLLDYGADPNAADNAQLTPLHLAAASGETKICNTLIARKAHAQPSAVNGVTPILLAAASGEIECIRDALLPNGCALASEHDDGRTAYDELLWVLKWETNKLNGLDSYDWVYPLVLLAVLHPVIVASAVVTVSLTAFHPGFWAFPIGLLMVLALMSICRRQRAPDKDTQALVDLLHSARSTVQFFKAVPGHADLNTMSQFVKTLYGIDNTLNPDRLQADANLVSVTDGAARVAEFIRLRSTVAEKMLCVPSDAQHEMSECEHIINTIIENRTTDRVRHVAIRQMLHTLLTDAEQDADVVSLASPFTSPWVIIKKRWDRLALLLCSTFVMVAVFAALCDTMFTMDGAVNFHFANQLANECIDKTKLGCADFNNPGSNRWLEFSNPDCVFEGVSVPSVPTLTPTPTPAATSVSVPAGTSRSVLIHSAARYDGFSPPRAEVTVTACTREHPRPRMTVKVVFDDDRSTEQARTGSWLLIVGGCLMFAAQVVVSVRWARARFVTHRLNGNDSYAKTVMRYFVLSTLYLSVAALAFALGVRRLQCRSLHDLEDMGIAVGLLSTYPGLAVLTWLPNIGYVIAPVLRTAFLGVVFVLGVISFVPLIPAIESFSIPFFVTDPQRAAVSFEDSSSPRTFYVAICVFWLLLGLRLFVAAANALAPENARAHYFQFFRTCRLALDLQPSLSSSKETNEAVAVDKFVDAAYAQASADSRNTASAKLSADEDAADAASRSSLTGREPDAGGDGAARHAVLGAAVRRCVSAFERGELVPNDQLQVASERKAMSLSAWYAMVEAANAYPRVRDSMSADRQLRAELVAAAVVRVYTAKNVRVCLWLLDGAGYIVFELLRRLKTVWSDAELDERLEVTLVDWMKTMNEFHAIIPCVTVRRGDIHTLIADCDVGALPQVVYFNYSTTTTSGTTMDMYEPGIWGQDGSRGPITKYNTPACMEATAKSCTKLLESKNSSVLVSFSSIRGKHDETLEDALGIRLAAKEVTPTRLGVATYTVSKRF